MRISAVLLVAIVVAAACGGTTVGGRLTLFLAASLTDSFNALSAEFTKQNPSLTIAPNYAGSGALVTQIVNGADADIFASADEANMQKLVDAKLSGGDPQV